MPQFSRKKPRRLWLSGSYRLYKLANRIFGSEHVLKILLNTHFVVERLSWESIATLYRDDAFGNENISNALSKWVSPGSRIVDVGCGSGRVAEQAARLGPVVAIDRYNGFRPVNGVEFRIGDAMEVKEHFDVAILSHILEHLDEPDRLLTSLDADLVIAEVPNFLHDGRNAFRERLGLPCYGDDDHVREYTVDEFKNQFERCGWIVKEVVANSAITLVATKA